MINIRQEQIQAFTAADQVNFIYLIGEHLCSADATTTAWIGDTLSALERLGINEKAALLRYFEIASRFPDLLWLLPIPTWVNTWVVSPHTQLVRIDSIEESLRDSLTPCEAANARS